MAAEKQFENKVKKFLEDEGCFFVKFFANAFTKKGIPDILCCCNGYFVGIETKADDGKPTALQLKKCREIRKAGGFAWVVYPTAFEQLKQLIKGLKQDTFNRECDLILK